MSEFLKLNILDLVKGTILASFTSVLVIIKDTIANGTLSFDWHSISQTALLSAVAYLLKNLLTNGNGELFKK